MAATRTIELRTEVPGPRSREVLARSPRVSRRRSRSPSRSSPPTRAGRCSPTSTATSSSTSPAASAASTSATPTRTSSPRRRSSSSASRTPTSRSSRTRSTRRWPSGCSRGRRSPAPRRRRSSTRAPRRSRTPSSSRALYTGRPGVIAFEGAFHGRTLLALSLTSKTHPYKLGSGRSRPRSTASRSRTPTAARRPPRRSPRCERAFVTLVAPENVAAIVVEPVQGEGGFIPAPAEFLQGLREICDEHGIVLVVDEVQTGFARTGRFFAVEHFGVEPDLITVAKSIAMGLPLSGVLGKAEIMDAPREGGGRRDVRREPGRDRRRAGRARRDRGRGPGRARERDRRDDHARGWSRGRPAGRRSATSAGSARCSRSSSSTDPETKEPAAELATRVIDAAPAARPAAPAGRRLRQLHPRARPARDRATASSTRRSASGKTPARHRFRAADSRRRPYPAGRWSGRSWRSGTSSRSSSAGAACRASTARATGFSAARSRSRCCTSSYAHRHGARRALPARGARRREARALERRRS